MPHSSNHNGAASRVDVALAELRKAIEQRQLVPGEPLRLEALSQRLNMSVQPIREAIRLLEAEGLVERSNNRGSIVAKVPLVDIIDLCATRTVVEPMMVSMATKRASDEELADIRRAHEELEDSHRRGDTTQDLVQMSIDWHLMIYAAARSRHLSDFVDQVWTAIRINTAWGSSLAQDLMEDHEAIIQAMESRDHVRSAEVMRRHIRDSVSRLIEGFTGESDLSLVSALDQYETLLTDLGVTAGLPSE